jgi:serine phosphatase RsbU (regulator of sigma subunit)
VLILPGQPDGEAEARLYLAGHPPPLLLRDGAAQEVGKPGPILGISDDAGWQAEDLVLQPGDQLMVYTDGVIEARADNGERFGGDRLRQGVAGCDSPAAVIAQVERALTAFAGDADEDDAAVVAVRRIATADASSAGHAWVLPGRVSE